MSKQKEEAIARKRVESIIAYKDVFESEKGQEVLYDLCKRFNYFQTSYKGDVNDCLFNEGGRNVINFILAQLQQDPSDLFTKLKKQMEKQREEYRVFYDEDY